MKSGGKVSWFDSHRQFFPMNHSFRRNKDAFYKNRIEKSQPPHFLTGNELWQKIHFFPKITKVGPCICDGHGVSHNWTKQSIFWKLPYWKTNLIRHNFDVMHVEKNVFDNVFNTMMDIKDKTKDNIKARMDLKDYCKRRELELQVQPSGKVLKPKAKFVLSNEQKNVVYKWINELKMPDRYASNLHRCVNLDQRKLLGMKSHDCHVLMEMLLPIAFCALPYQVWNPIVELSMFFKDLCSTILRMNNLLLIKNNIIITTCKLERIFPPGFFNSMEHLPIHLPYEARVGGPVQY